MDDQHSRATRAQVVGPRVRLAVREDSHLAPRAHGVDQLSRATREQVCVPAGSTSSPASITPGSEALGGATRFPWCFGPESEGPRGRPAIPGDSGPCPRSRDVDQHSWATLARVRGTVGSTRCPGQLGLLSEVPRGPPALPGDWHSGPRARGIDQLSQSSGPCSEGPRGRPALPGDSHSSPRAHGVHQHFRATRALVDGPQCRPPLPGDSGPCLRSCGLYQICLLYTSPSPRD